MYRIWVYIAAKPLTLAQLKMTSPIANITNCPNCPLCILCFCTTKLHEDVKKFFSSSKTNRSI